MLEDDLSIMTGIIDWQSLCIEPALWYADEVSDFATCLSLSGSLTYGVDDDDLCV